MGAIQLTKLRALTPTHAHTHNDTPTNAYTHRNALTHAQLGDPGCRIALAHALTRMIKD